MKTRLAAITSVTPTVGLAELVDEEADRVGGLLDHHRLHELLEDLVDVILLQIRLDRLLVAQLGLFIHLNIQMGGKSPAKQPQEPALPQPLKPSLINQLPLRFL